MPEFIFISPKTLVILSILLLLYAVIAPVLLWLGCGPAYATLMAGLVCVEGLAGIAFLILSIIMIARQKGSARILAAVALAINLVSLIGPEIISPSDVWHEWRLRRNIEDYRAVVDLAEAGQLPMTGRFRAQLPQEYEHLTACSNEILVDVGGPITKVLFYTFIDSETRFTGLYYRASGEPIPVDFQIPFGAWACQPLREPGWFSCAHYE